MAVDKLAQGVLVMYNTVMRFINLFIHSFLRKRTMSAQWHNDTPIYLQLYQQVVSRILEGYIKEGEALPSVRRVAAEYQLNPITISKAYQMLQDEALVEKQRGKGLFVKEGTQALMLAREREAFLTKQWPEILQKISLLKLSAAELLASNKEVTL